MFLSILFLCSHHCLPATRKMSRDHLSPRLKRFRAISYFHLSIQDAGADRYCAVCSVVQWCLTLWGSMDYCPLGSSVHGIFLARILKRVAISFSRGSSRPSDQTCISYISCIGGWILYHQCHVGSPQIGTVLCLVTQLCLILLRPLPGSSVRGDSPGKNMEWVAMPSSRGSY